MLLPTNAISSLATFLSSHTPQEQSVRPNPADLVTGKSLVQRPKDKRFNVISHESIRNVTLLLWADILTKAAGYLSLLCHLLQVLLLFEYSRCLLEQSVEKAKIVSNLDFSATGEDGALEMSARIPSSCDSSDAILTE